MHPDETAGDPNRRLPDAIHARIRKWQDARSRPEWRQALRTRTSDEVSCFLGEGAARIVLQPVAEDCRNLLSTIEPVLAQILGDRAAAAVVGRVTNSAIVRF